MKILSVLADLKPNYLSQAVQSIIIPDCHSLLDVGCGENSVVQYFNQKLKKTVGIDLFKGAINKSRKKKIHNKYINADVMEIDRLFPDKSFDCVLSIDVIEHLPKKKAIALIKKMEKISRKKIVIQTTNGFVKQDPVGGNIYQIHKCGFTVTELRKRGYKVFGMDGPMFFRGECAKIKYKPEILFAIISALLDGIFRFIPEYSFNLLACKDVGSQTANE